MPTTRLIKKVLLILAILVLLTEGAAAEPAAEHLTVIMPEVRPPFDKVFSEIFEGIRSEFDGQVVSISISETATSSDMRSLLEANSASKVIGLGNHARKLLKPLESEFRVIYGATFLNPGEESDATEGISLTPSPLAIFKWLHQLTPEINQVHVVYQPDYSGWLIELAKTAASENGIKLVPHPVKDVREAATEFRDILNNANPANSAIWLTQRDPSLDERAVVPDILAQAWSKNFVVFSSNPAHVPRGALFALYPNNEKMGTSLARIAENRERDGITPLEDLDIAINIRTASHVGKNFSRREEKQFDLIFPNR